MQADLAKDPKAPSSCYRMSTQLLMLGKTLTGLRVTEMLGTLDYFAGLDDVDAKIIGIVGFSGGSLIAYVAAALDERIRRRYDRLSDTLKTASWQFITVSATIRRAFLCRQSCRS